MTIHSLWKPKENVAMCLPLRNTFASVHINHMDGRYQPNTYEMFE